MTHLTKAAEKWHRWTSRWPRLNGSRFSDIALFRHAGIIKRDRPSPCKHFMCGFLRFHLKSSRWSQTLHQHHSSNCLACRDLPDLTHWYCQPGMKITCKVLWLPPPKTALLLQEHSIGVVVFLSISLCIFFTMSIQWITTQLKKYKLKKISIWIP